MAEIIYRDMDKAALDAGYNARASVPDPMVYLNMYREKTDAVKEKLPDYKTHHYGDGADETLDLYLADEGAPLFVYIHGGYWRALGREDSGFMVENMIAHGISVAVLNYSLVPAVTLDGIVHQMHMALAWLWQNADGQTYDKNRIYVAGSSAGGHLSAMMLGDSWLTDFGLKQNPVVGGILISGIYDIKPLQLCLINDWMNFDDNTVARNSPIHHIPKNCPPLIVTYGGNESSEFRRQAEEYSESLTTAGHSVDCFGVPMRNHFDIVLDMCESDSMFFKKIKAMILGD